MAASATGLIEVVDRLIAAGADVNATEPFQNQTALMWAAEAGHAQVVSSLIAAGADLDVVTNTYEALARDGMETGRQSVGFSMGGMTAVMYAARSGHTEAIRALAEAGADLNHANPDEITALIIAVINDRLDAAATLVDYGANTNDGSMYELGQLHNINLNEVIQGDSTRPRRFYENEASPEELLQLMLDAGADPNFVSSHALHADAMARASIVTNSAYEQVLGNQDTTFLRLMLASGQADPNYIGEGKTLPLNALIGGAGGGGGGGGGGFFAGFGQTQIKRYTAERGLESSVDVLLEFGADVTAASPQGDTPLHIAAQGNNTALIQRFYDMGADLNATNPAGFTALDAAMGERAPQPEGAGRGDFGRGGPPSPQPEAVNLLRELMGLPALPEVAIPSAIPGGRGR